jgi:hypothetical protein
MATGFEREAVGVVVLLSSIAGCAVIRDWWKEEILPLLPKTRRNRWRKEKRG